MVTLDLNPDARAVRGFARLWFPLFVVVLGSILRWRFGWVMAANVTWMIGAVLAIAALASPRIARGIFIALTIATYPIALVISTVLMTAVYFAVMTPLGMWLRMRGHDPLQLLQRDAASHWHRYEQDDDPKRAVRQF
jgi:hypothetical protein